MMWTIILFFIVIPSKNIFLLRIVQYTYSVFTYAKKRGEQHNLLFIKLIYEQIPHLFF